MLRWCSQLCCGGALTPPLIGFTRDGAFIRIPVRCRLMVNDIDYASGLAQMVMIDWRQDRLRMDLVRIRTTQKRGEFDVIDF